MDNPMVWAAARSGAVARWRRVFDHAIERLSMCFTRAEVVRDQLRDLMVEHLGHPDAVLIVNEPGS